MAGQVKEPPEHFEEAYVIGTGFSKSFGEGLLATNLYKEVLCYCSSPPGSHSFPTLREQLERFVSEYVASDSQNLVNGSVDMIRLFTMLQVAESEWGASLQHIKDARPSDILSQLKKALGCVYHKKLMDTSLRQKLDCKFFHDLPHWVPIMSLNWDNLLEYGLYIAGRQVIYLTKGYHKKPHHVFDWRERCFVFKPHGSIDYFLSSDAWADRRSCDEYYPLTFPLDSQAKARGALTETASAHRWRSIENIEKREVIEKMFVKPYEPLILTLGHFKLSGKIWETPASRERLTKAVREAEHFLARSQRIIVIGYSLPEDDYEIELLLRSSVARRKRQYNEWPEIIVVNPDDSVAERFKKHLHRDVIVKSTQKGQCFDPNVRGGFVEDALVRVT